MPANKYDQETQARAIRMYRDHIQEHPGISKLAARKHISAPLDIKQATLNAPRTLTQQIAKRTIRPLTRTEVVLVNRERTSRT